MPRAPSATRCRNSARESPRVQVLRVRIPFRPDVPGLAAVTAQRAGGRLVAKARYSFSRFALVSSNVNHAGRNSPGAYSGWDRQTKLRPRIAEP